MSDQENPNPVGSVNEELAKSLLAGMTTLEISKTRTGRAYTTIMESKGAKLKMNVDLMMVGAVIPGEQKPIGAVACIARFMEDGPRIFKGLKMRDSEEGDGDLTRLEKVVFHICRGPATPEYIRQKWESQGCAEGIYKWLMSIVPEGTTTTISKEQMIDLIESRINEMPEFDSNLFQFSPKFVKAKADAKKDETAKGESNKPLDGEISEPE